MSIKLSGEKNEGKLQKSDNKATHSILVTSIKTKKVFTF